jgi:hypothetical protein
LTSERATLDGEVASIKRRCRRPTLRSSVVECAISNCDGSGRGRKRSAERRRPSSDECKATSSDGRRPATPFVTTWRIIYPSVLNSRGGGRKWLGSFRG